MRVLAQAEVAETVDDDHIQWMLECAARITEHITTVRTLKAPIKNATLASLLGIGSDDIVLGSVGPFSPYEGLDLLLEACTELVQNGEKLKLLLVGDSQPLIGASAANRADTGLKETAPWLIQVGRVPHDQIADYYALLDVVVIPRKPLAVCQLVPPMTAAEALAYGKRVVVSEVIPLAEYAQKYEGVVSFEAGSAASLASALQRSLKLLAPKPSTELLLSAHTDPMVRALKGKGSDEVQKAVVDAQAQPPQSKPKPTAPTKASNAAPMGKPVVESKVKAQTQTIDKPAINRLLKKSADATLVSKWASFSCALVELRKNVRVGHRLGRRVWLLKNLFQRPVKLTRDITWQRFDLKGDSVIRILGNVSIKNGGDKAGVMLVEIFDKNGKKISPDEMGLPKSEVFGSSFLYLQDTKRKQSQLAIIDSAKNIAYARVGFTLFGATDKTTIEVYQLEVKTTKLAPQAAASPNSEKPKQASDYKVANKETARFDISALPAVALRDTLGGQIEARVGPALPEAPAGSAEGPRSDVIWLTRTTVLDVLATAEPGRFVIDWAGLQTNPPPEGSDWALLWSIEDMRLNRQIMDAVRIALDRGWRVQVLGPVRRSQAPLYRSVASVVEEILPDGASQTAQHAPSGGAAT